MSIPNNIKNVVFLIVNGLAKSGIWYSQVKEFVLFQDWDIDENIHDFGRMLIRQGYREVRIYQLRSYETRRLHKYEINALMNFDQHGHAEDINRFIERKWSFTPDDFVSQRDNEPDSNHDEGCEK